MPARRQARPPARRWCPPAWVACPPAEEQPIGRCRMDFMANVLLAAGASPAMAHSIAEARGMHCQPAATQRCPALPDRLHRTRLCCDPPLARRKLPHHNASKP